MMNGALYISFFQGQLESAMEHVVQLAVQEITKTVGSSLNSMLQETTTKDQENQRLRSRLQSRQPGGVGNASVSSDSNVEGNAANDGTKTLHTPSQSSEHAVHTNTHWLEEKERAVGQLKVVMEQVLKFALAELTKIVEDSFDDLLQELLKTEKENVTLSVRVQAEGRSKEENHSGSPSLENPEEPLTPPLHGTGNLQGKKAAETTANAPEKQAVLSVTQDWVPILDKVFGQKWCRDLWQVREVGMAESDLTSAMGVGAFPECIIQDEEDLPLIPSAVLEAGENGGALQTIKMEEKSGASVSGSPGCSSPLAAEGHLHGDGVELRLRSPSMLHRLLTLPSQGLGQLLCSDANMDALPSHAEASPPLLLEPQADPVSPPKLDPGGPTAEEEEEEGEEDEGQSPQPDGQQRNPSARKMYPCRRCGKKFGRLPLLRSHQLTHAEAAPSRCSLCGKRFASASRLQAHLRTHTDQKGT
ncbi:hypothetical protein GJAV_G00225390 [Gymnothorax javanicus]|nr:hypothetical protein GJAV_G00225390 [Gymnothorax javanicus]